MANKSNKNRAIQQTSDAGANINAPASRTLTTQSVQVASTTKSKLNLFLFVILAVLCLAPSVWARPVFIVMDVESQDNAPKNFGYEVAASRVDKETKFVINLDSAASAAFRSAHIFFHTPVKDKPTIPIKITVQSDKKSKQITFAVPTEHLIYCILQIDSRILRRKDNVINFYAYRLRLDNVK